MKKISQQKCKCGKSGFFALPTLLIESPIVDSGYGQRKIKSKVVHCHDCNEKKLTVGSRPSA